MCGFSGLPRRARGEVGVGSNGLCEGALACSVEDPVERDGAVLFVSNESLDWVKFPVSRAVLALNGCVFPEFP